MFNVPITRTELGVLQSHWLHAGGCAKSSWDRGEIFMRLLYLDVLCDTHVANEELFDEWGLDIDDLLYSM